MEAVCNAVMCLARSLLICLRSLVLFFVPAHYRMKSVEGDVVLITGGGSGIGRLLAKRLAKRGARIVTWDVNAEGNEETVRQVRAAGGEAHAYTCDLSSREMIYKTAERVKKEVGKVTILVNNAGIVSGKLFLDTPDKLIEKTFEVNTLAHFWTCKAFLPDMLATKKGHVVNIASLAGMQGMGRLADYCASKFAAVGFHESLTVELKVEGHDEVKTTVICPFFINTGMFDGAKSGIIPFLEPEYVSERIETAILLNEEHVIIPSTLTALFFLKLSLNYDALHEIGSALRLANPMENFKGRAPAANGATNNGITNGTASSVTNGITNGGTNGGTNGIAKGITKGSADGADGSLQGITDRVSGGDDGLRARHNGAASAPSAE